MRWMQVSKRILIQVGLMGLLTSCTPARSSPAAPLPPAATPTSTPAASSSPTPTLASTTTPALEWETGPVLLLSRDAPDRPIQAHAVALSADGRWALWADATERLWLWDRTQRASNLIRAPDGQPARGWAPALSGDGQVLAFFARHPLPDAPPADLDCRPLAVYDRGRGQWEWIPAAGAREGFFDLALSADGRWVVWASSAACPPGPGVYLYDRQTRELRPVHPARGRTAVTGGAQVALSADGRWLAFAAPDDGIVPEDRNGVFDVFLYDRETQRVEWLSHPLDPRDPPLPSGVHPVPNTDGAWEGGLTISADGRYVAFASAARLVEGAFAPCAPWPWSDPLPFCRHIYLYDRATGQRTLVDRNERGEAGDGAAEGPGISGDGRYVVYATRAKNLGGLEIGPCPPRAAWGRPCDLRLAVWDRERGRTFVLSRGWDGRTVEGPSYDPVLSADGRWLAWTSEAIGWTQQVVPVSGNRPAPYLYLAELEALLQIQK